MQVFKAVLAECSMSQAAMRLRTSASNVKRIVTALEGELGVPLFDRESRGKFQPTTHADRLNQEMTGFMEEMESLQQYVSQIRETGRTLKIGAQRWFFETAYFVRLFNLMRQDNRFRATFLEVATGQERTMVESGACDVYVGLVTPASKRVTTVHLAPLPMSVGCVAPGFVPRELSDLSEISPWGLHAPDLRAASREWLQCIEIAGGGIGRQLTSSQFREWSTCPSSSNLQAVVAPAPAEGTTEPSIRWQPLPLLTPIPVRASFLSQHPYGCLEHALHKASASLKQHEHSV
ncbi:LysR family transcriptional regulator [Luteolibacter sp. LG18]|uniref:LysR family transcriptional regulator n=1 Tax=Luteolibacter sp. LG18 TaxID=2819286 RepID=UPI0030C6C679